jgi:STE24 endopeptidase
MIAINTFLAVYLVIYLFSSGIDAGLELLNSRHLKKFNKDVPDGFDGIIDENKLVQITNYSIDNIRLALFQSAVGKVIFLSIILMGILPWLSDTFRVFPYLVAGLLFFAIPSLIGAVADIPFSYLQIFRIEERYGFNTRTIRIWITDIIKGLILLIILGGILLSLLLLMVRHAGDRWWIWAWLIFFGFQHLILVIYPTLIAPLFNKFTPLPDGELADRIGELANKEGLNITGIFQMDAERRSRHTNAYFTGLGKTKRIVLYDTLLKSHDHDEILAVLAHEIGHMKKGHIRKRLVLTGLVSFVIFFIASRMISWDLLYRSFGFSNMPEYAGLFLIGVLWESVGFFLSPLGMAISRRFEREADHYMYNSIKTAEPLIRALKKMTTDNLSNLNPHPAYAKFNYSHPPVVERVRYLEGFEVGLQ